VTVGPTARDGEIEALVVDRYLESLLSREALHERDVPADLLATARQLASGVRRYHPSFRFEEDLAARLAAMASERTGRLIEFPIATRALAAGDERAATVRPVVIGGVTSAALALAGAAYVAWRRGRPPAHAMTRAVRAVARTRTS